MTRKIDFFGRRLQFQRTIPGFLENLGCLTLSNSKISEGVSFVFKKIAKVERAEEKFVFQRRRKILYIVSLQWSQKLFYTAVQVLYYIFDL